MEFRVVQPSRITPLTHGPGSTNSAPVGGKPTLTEIISPRSLSLRDNGTQRHRREPSKEPSSPTADSATVNVKPLTPRLIDESPKPDENRQAAEKIPATAIHSDEEAQDHRADFPMPSNESSEAPAADHSEKFSNELKNAQLPHIVATKNPRDGAQRSKTPNKNKRLLPRSKNTNLHDLNSAPASGAELAEKVKDQIAKTSFNGNTIVRVLLIFVCAAGGTIPVNPDHPETVACAKKLTDLPTEERFYYLKRLFSQLGAYMTRDPILMTTGAIGKIFVNPEEIDSILKELRSELQEQLRLLEEGVN